jgi:hypothetical protein
VIECCGCGYKDRRAVLGGIAAACAGEVMSMGRRGHFPYRNNLHTLVQDNFRSRANRMGCNPHPIEGIPPCLL